MNLQDNDFPGDDRYLNRPRYKAERFAGYYPVWRSNTPTDQTQLANLFSIPADDRSSLRYFSVSLNTNRLLVQLAAAVLITAILTVLVSSGNKTWRQRDDRENDLDWRNESY